MQLAQARPQQARPHRRGKAGSQGRRSFRETRPHGREELSSTQGPLEAPGRKGSDFVSGCARARRRLGRADPRGARARAAVADSPWVERQAITRRGSPYPLGANVHPAGVNFSVFSKGSTRVELMLFDGVDDARRHVAPRRGVLQSQWRAGVSLARRGPGRGDPRCLGAEAAQRQGSETFLPKATEGSTLQSARNCHRQALELHNGAPRDDGRS